MVKLNSENLLLLEFLVDTLCLDKCTQMRTPPGEKCVSFQFLDNLPLEVCEEDFMPPLSYSCDDNITKNGKSCLFSITPDLAEALSKEFNLNVTVYMRPDPECGDKIGLGTVVIPLQKLFNDLMDSIDEESGCCSTPKSFRDEFEMLDETQRVSGTISLYIRMSCFGKLIITQFQMNMSDQSVLFKDKEGKSLYRYKKVGGGKCRPANQQKLGGEKCSQMDPGFFNQTCPAHPCGPPQYTPMMNQMGFQNQMPNQFAMQQPNQMPNMFSCPPQQGFGSPVPRLPSGGGYNIQTQPRMNFPFDPNTLVDTSYLGSGRIGTETCMQNQFGIGGMGANHMITEVQNTFCNGRSTMNSTVQRHKK